jgi:hypothetical protein
VLFADPDAPTRVRDELDVELRARGFDSARDARGIAHRTDARERTEVHANVR